MKSLPVRSVVFSAALLACKAPAPAPIPVAAATTALAIPSASVAPHAEPPPLCTPKTGEAPPTGPVGICEFALLDGAAGAPYAAALVQARGKRGKGFETVVKQACGGKVVETSRYEPDSQPSGTMELDVWVNEGGKRTRLENAFIAGTFDFDGDGTPEPLVFQEVAGDRGLFVEKKTKASVYFASGVVSTMIPHVSTDTLEAVGEGKRTVVLKRHGQTALNGELFASQDLEVFAFSKTGPEPVRGPLPKSNLARIAAHCTPYADALPKMTVPAQTPVSPGSSFLSGLAPKCTPLGDADRKATIAQLQTQLAALFKARGATAEEPDLAKVPAPVMPEVAVDFGCALPSGTLLTVHYSEGLETSVSELWRRAPNGTVTQELSLRGLIGAEWYHMFSVEVLGSFTEKPGAVAAPLVGISEHEIGSMESATTYYLWPASGPVVVASSSSSNTALVARPEGDLLVGLPTNKVAPWATSLEEAVKLPWTEKSLTVLAPKVAPKGALADLIRQTATARAALPKP
jgi:hypothetical protein